MREKAVEQALVRRVKARGGVAVKLTGVVGIPDRLVLLPGGRVIFVEVKRPRGGRVSRAQAIWIARLRALGAEVWVVRDKAGLERMLAGAGREGV